MRTKPDKPDKPRATVEQLWFVAQGVPQPEVEHRFAPPRKWRFDYAWPALKVALEVEGGVWSNGRHTRGSGFIGDMEKYNEAAALGWCLIRVTPKSLLTLDTVRLIQRAATAAKKEGE